MRHSSHLQKRLSFSVVRVPSTYRLTARRNLYFLLTFLYIIDKLLVSTAANGGEYALYLPEFSGENGRPDKPNEPRVATYLHAFSRSLRAVEPSAGNRHSRSYDVCFFNRFTSATIAGNTTLADSPM